MIGSFLHIIQIQKGSNSDAMSEFAAYYKSDSLAGNLANIMGKGIGDTLLKGKKILLKPNWVRHSIKPEDELCLRTNDNFLLAALKIILTREPDSVTIADAPIQGCRWDDMISKSFLDSVRSLSDECKIPVHVKDFRRRTYSFTQNKLYTSIRPLSDYLIFDLGKLSCLEPITDPRINRFRVTDYDPDLLSSSHSSGMHKFCIARDFFDADIVISVPKIKTHQKTGITGAVKNVVGINGDKDFLPHHRTGGTKKGGDCYPGGSFLRYWSELMLDNANRRQGKKEFRFWQKLSSILWKLSFPGPLHNLAAGWHGNDTTWRMVKDLNRIVIYGRSDGTVSGVPQRRIYSLCDGIIAGQGDGPLDPVPLPLGVISFSDNALVNDRAMAILMGFPPDKIPLLSEDAIYNTSDCSITFNGMPESLNGLKQHAIKTVPPKGWKAYFNRSV